MYLMITTSDSHADPGKVVAYLPIEDLDVAMRPSLFGSRNFNVTVRNGKLPSATAAAERDAVT